LVVGLIEDRVQIAAVLPNEHLLVRTLRLRQRTKEEEAA
jgi:hypothetical protein